MPGTTGFRACYRHPRRPAIKNCQYCEKPICRECELESGDHRMCGPCKKKLVSSGSPETQPQAAPLDLGEVTIFDDGTVHTPAAASSSAEETGEEALPPVREEVEEPSTYPEDATPLATPPAAIDKAESEKPAVPGGCLSQIAYALPFAFGIALLLGGAWLLMAFILKQWTQISVFTVGLVVPWVFFSATTRKKRAGKRVWTEPPVVMVSIFSFTMVAVIAPVMESLAYKLVYPGNVAFSVFVQDYFGGTDWLLLSCGLALALLTPFLLKAGGRWDVPRLRIRSKRKPVGRDGI